MHFWGALLWFIVMLLGAALYAVFVYFSTSADSVEESQAWIGIFLPTFLLYIVCSVFASKKWFNTLKLSASFVLLTLTSIGNLVFYLLWVGYNVDYTETYGVLESIQILAAYSVLFVWAVMVNKCKDDGWAIGWFVGCSFVLSLALSGGIIAAMWLLNDEITVPSCFPPSLHPYQKTKPRRGQPGTTHSKVSTHPMIHASEVWHKQREEQLA